MTKSRLILSTLRLRSVQAFGALAVLLASACAPTAPSSPAAVDASATPVSVDSPASTATPLPVQPEATSVPTEAAAQPVATSRGPDLEATDPTTVKLASGQLQLVEFFRFT